MIKVMNAYLICGQTVQAFALHGGHRQAIQRSRVHAAVGIKTVYRIVIKRRAL